MSDRRGRRPSRQRSALLALLDDLDGFRTAQELHAMLRDREDAVGLATVYRTLQSLVERGEVDVVRSVAGEAAYRRCSTGHHHHLLCRRCGRAVEVANHSVERWAERVAARHGFADVQHRLDVMGTCDRCVPHP